MKKKIILLSFIGAITFGMATFSGCKKTDNAPATSTVDTETQQSATDNSHAEKTFNDVFDASTDAVQQTSGTYKTMGYRKVLLTGCEKVTLDSGILGDTTSWPKSITITFGNGVDSCVGMDGRFRKGKIHITLQNKRYRETGSKMIVWLENYYVDGFKVEGTKTVTNTGTRTDANGTYIQHVINVTGGKITSPQGKVGTWQSTRTRNTYINSDGWPLFWLVTGDANGTNMRGNSYTMTINNPLRFAPVCKYCEEGSLTISPAGKTPVTIDFGNGLCDSKATITVNGKSYIFYMR